MVHHPVSTDLPCLRVDDTFSGLQRLGQAARQRCGGRIVAITGSSGKTTLRHWTESILRLLDQTHASTGSLNNHWGVPLSLSRMPADSRFGILEIGTNSPGEIAPLSRLVAPHISVLLNVLPAHIGNFDGMAALQAEKLSIAAGLEPDGIFILPTALAGASAHGRKLTFGFEPESDVCAVGLKEGIPSRLDVRMPDGRRCELMLPFASRERMGTVLALMAILYALDVDPSRVLEAFSTLSLPAGRGNAHQIGDIVVIDDSYNANPASSKMAIQTLLGSEVSGRRIALLGELLELGDLAASAHQEVIEAASGLDIIYTFGEGFEPLQNAATCFYPSVADLDLDTFVNALQPGDHVLVKGSNKVFWKHGFVDNLLKRIGALRGHDQGATH